MTYSDSLRIILLAPVVSIMVLGFYYHHSLPKSFYTYTRIRNRIIDETSKIGDLLGNYPNLTSNPPISRLSSKFDQCKKFRFKFLTKPEIAFKNSANYSIILYIRSAPKEFDLRNKFRELWSPDQMRNLGICVVFAVGSSKDGQLDDQIFRENYQYKDILMADFQDAYKNLSVKMSTVFHFHKHCLPVNLHPIHIFWGNTDTRIHTQNFVTFIRSSPRKDWLAGWKNVQYLVLSEEHHKSIKWYIPKEVYPNQFYPDFVNGGGTFASNDVFLKFADVSEKTSLWVLENFSTDDALITGVWRDELHIDIQDCGKLCCDYLNCNVPKTDVCTRWKQSVFYHAFNVDTYFDHNVGNCTNATVNIILNDS